MRNSMLLCFSLVACGPTGETIGGDTGVDAVAPPDHVGSIALHSYEYAVPGGGVARGTSVGADFYPNPPPTWITSEPACRTQTFESVMLARASAGTVRIETTPRVTLSPDSDDSYTPVTLTTPQSGDTSFDVTATGGDVPAFSGEIRVPARATLTGARTPTVPRDRDLVLLWSGGSDYIAFDLGGSDASSVHVSCSFEASAGRGSVPADLLQRLPAGQGNVAMHVYARSEVTVEDWGISLYGSNVIAFPDGTAAVFAVTLE